MARSISTTLRLVAILVLTGSTSAWSLEADPYWGAERELADATLAVNAWMNMNIEDVLAESEGLSCSRVSRRIMRRFHFFIFHELELWPLNSSLVSRAPQDREEFHSYRRNELYHNQGALDTGMWMPIVALIEIDGVRMGTDKLSHFASSGWRYRNKYLREIHRGKTPEEAEEKIIRKSIVGERTAMGSLTTGVFSLGDLEANYQGMKFYLSLCEGPEPLLVRSGEGWTLREPVDMARYVTPEWDESYQTSGFSGFRWRKVKPVISRYCFLLDDPVFQARLDRYRHRDQETATEKVLAELQDEGWDPRRERFTLSANCPDPQPLPFSVEGSPAVETEVPTRPDPRELELAVRAEKDDTEVRAIGVLGIQLNYPKTLAVSLGVLLSRVPRSLDCPAACELNGMIFQLEPGLTGGQFSIGWSKIYGARRRESRTLSQVFLAFGGKVSLLRPWGSFSSGIQDKTHLGVEGEFTVAQVNFSLGAFRPTNPDAGEGDWLFTGGIGWGF